MTICDVTCNVNFKSYRRGTCKHIEVGDRVKLNTYLIHHQCSHIICTSFTYSRATIFSKPNPLV